MNILTRAAVDRVLWHVCLLVASLLFTQKSMAEPATYVRHYNFANDVSVSNWQVTGDQYACRLSQVIHDYGQVKFVTRAGQSTIFELESWQGLTTQTQGRISLIPPGWRHDLLARHIGKFTLHAGNDILQLDAKHSKNLLSALFVGYKVSLDYVIEVLGRELVTVQVSPVDWNAAFEKYNQCLNKLLPYDFDTIRITDVYFDVNSEELNLLARKELNKIARYWEAGPKLSKVVIKGYADKDGSYDHNRRLAGRRAEAVKAYLINNGFKPELLVIEDVFERYRLVSQGKKSRRVNIELFK